MRIVVFDTDDELAKSLGLFLRLNGYECFTTNNHVDALSLVNTYRPDVVVSEYFSNDDDYLKLFELIRQKQKNTKIIVLTSISYSLYEISFLYDLDIHSIFQKPFSPELLLDVIHAFEHKYLKVL